MTGAAQYISSGPHYRSNPFGAPVIVAPARGARPHDSRRYTQASRQTAPDPPSEPSFDPNCPFCPGNEQQTPPELDADRPHAAGEASRSDTPDWAVRVVPNKFPALVADDRGLARVGTSPFAAWPAHGAHEVVIHSPDHTATLANIEAEPLARAMSMWQARLRAHRSAGWAASTLVVNEGREAGASLAHPHAQIFATDIVPPDLSDEIFRQESQRAESGRYILHDVVDAERQGPRVVDTEGTLVAWVPYWSSVPYEVWISSPAADSDTGGFADSRQMFALARLSSRVARRLEVAAGHPAFNVVLRDPPHTGSDVTWWHLRLRPRNAIAAGFELGTGIDIVPMLPEDAAADLRGAL